MSNADDGVDLVVAGAGGGLVAALRAASLGRSVLVVERNTHFALGNNTSMSTAMIPGAGTRWQRASGIDDDADQLLADVVAKTGGTAHAGVAAALAGVSGRLVEWLADEAALPLSLVTDFRYPGHSRLRCHTVPGRSGQVLLAGLLDAVRQHELIDLMVPAELVSVSLGAAGVDGVVVRTPGGEEEIPTGAVLLATSGYAADPAAVAEHIPEIDGAVYHGSEAATGDALRLGRALGAAVGDLDAYQGHAALAMPAATLVGWATVMHGGFLVGRNGSRFGDETAGYSEYASTVLSRAGGEAWIVLDRRVHEACLAFQDYRDTVASGALKWAATPAELAAVIGVEVDGLSRTMRESAACARGDRVDRWGRRDWGAPLAGELGAVAVRPALFHTQGGLLVDEHARVLRPDDAPFPGLYASGGAAIGMSGRGAAGYLAGNGLLAALGLAFLAGEHVGMSGTRG